MAETELTLSVLNKQNKKKINCALVSMFGIFLTDRSLSLILVNNRPCTILAEILLYTWRICGTALNQEFFHSLSFFLFTKVFLLFLWHSFFHELDNRGGYRGLEALVGYWKNVTIGKKPVLFRPRELWELKVWMMTKLQKEKRSQETEDLQLARARTTQEVVCFVSQDHQLARAWTTREVNFRTGRPSVKHHHFNSLSAPGINLPLVRSGSLPSSVWYQRSFRWKFGHLPLSRLRLQMP